ncbi:MAG: NADH dehydrogenase (quinone) subunit D [Thermotogae bacterium]|nr:NADH dehydrogenase (quinone) subunit D [Thermotogota bacterium]
MATAGVKTETFVLNMGPQHPATHGVLRVELELDGETVVRAKCRIGYLHRGTEKTAEYKSYLQIIPYTDRLDYLAPLYYNWAYVLTVERLLGIDKEIPERAEYLRVILGELSRIASHLVWFGTHVMDVGAWTPFLYAFREREKIYDLLEELTGQRMNNSFLRIGGVAADTPEGWLKKVADFLDEFEKAFVEMDRLITKNPILIARLKDVGILSPEDALNLGATGPMLRGSGIKRDIRKDEPYSIYDRFEFEIPVGEKGDSYDRYIVRMEEIRQSVRILRQALRDIPEGDVLHNNYKFVPPPKSRIYASIEELIHHFKLVTEGVKVPPGEAYFPVEAPKGELGFYIVSDGSARPWRMGIRAPSFTNLQTLEHMAPGLLVADIIVLIGTIDIVLGDVDR